MGMDAKTHVWVGYDAEQVFGKLPDEIADEIENAGEIKVDGVVIRDFHVTDDRVGLGAGLLYHDWDYGLKEIDLDDLAEKASHLKLKVAQIFKGWGIDDEPKVLLASNFS
jgi:hypothetical protein